MDTDSLTVHVKSEDMDKDLAGDVQKRIHTSNYEVKRSLTIGKNKKKFGLMKDELGGKLMKEFVTLDPRCVAVLTRKQKVQRSVSSNGK